MRVTTSSFIVLSMPSSDHILKIIELAGKTCYKSEASILDRSAPKFVKKILQAGHHSVIEHISISVKIICDRGVSHEIVRHRLASYSQECESACNNDPQNGIIGVEN